MVPGVYTHSMEAIYLSQMHTGSRGKLLREIPVTIFFYIDLFNNFLCLHITLSKTV